MTTLGILVIVGSIFLLLFSFIVGHIIGKYAGYTGAKKNFRGIPVYYSGILVPGHRYTTIARSIDYSFYIVLDSMEGSKGFIAVDVPEPLPDSFVLDSNFAIIKL